MIESLALLAGIAVFAVVCGIFTFYVAMAALALVWPDGELGILVLAQFAALGGLVAGFVFGFQYLFDVAVTR